MGAVPGRRGCPGPPAAARGARCCAPPAASPSVPLAYPGPPGNYAVSRAAGGGSSSGALGGAAVMTLDVAAVRAAYPALADGYAYLDGAAGTQVPATVIDAISAAHRSGLGNSGGAFPASQRADEIEAQCRQAVADLTGGSAGGVILGPNMTTLTYRLAGTLARAWGPGDEVVVSRLDHDANVRPWVQAAARAGAVVRWAEVELPAGELPAGQTIRCCRNGPCWWRSPRPATCSAPAP